MEVSFIDISIVVPVYNSESTISELTSRIISAMDARQISYELILVDDDSQDNSWQLIKEICKSKKWIKGLHLAMNVGQWCSSIAGISMAKGKYIVTIDDDLEYNPEDILMLYDAIISSPYRVVFGIAKDKYRMQGKSDVFSRLRNNVLNLLWNKGPTDSFKIFSRDLVFEKQDYKLNIHFEAYIASHLDRKLWGYCKIGYNKRKSGLSNHSLWKKIKLFCLFSTHYLYIQSRKPCYNISQEIN